MRIGRIVAAWVLVVAAPAGAAPQPPEEQKALARDVYRELVETDTTPSGDTLAAARAMAARLVGAGFAKDDVQVFEPAPRRGDLVARLRGSGKKKPLLLMAHIDVVNAKREDWSTDPFKLIEKDGYFYGRGTGDDKFMASAWVANMMRWKKEGYRPDRDVIVVLETDEELSDANGIGIQWLIKNHRDLLDAELALNEGGGVGMKDGRPLFNGIQTSEKLYQSFWLEVKNKGGHSSQPRADNAIYELAAALERLSKHAFPFELNDTTRAAFQTMAKIETGPDAADMAAVAAAKPDPAAIARLSAKPPYNAQMRTTCVATRLEGGHADNALPQVARAMINCRILPGHPVAEVARALADVIADPAVTITPIGGEVASQPSPVNPALWAAVTTLTAKFWPGVPLMPTMSAGATDGLFLRNAGIPCYGHSGLASDLFDVRAHGKDERVAVQAFYDGQEYLYELVKLLAGGK
jgi:acetylornithine deacetylase/succinyl-diaminopimelate desuccinylase-like protein